MHELKEALELLSNRIDRQLLESWEQASWPEKLLEHLRSRTEPRLVFGPDNAAQIIRLCRDLDPDEYTWRKRIADQAVAGRLLAAANPYCERFVEVDRKTFDFSKFDHWDSEALHGLNRQRELVCMAQMYWLDQDPMYYDAILREWDFYATKVPPPTEELLASINSFDRSSMHPPYSELDVYIRLMNWWWTYWLIIHSPLMTPERNVVLLARILRLFDRVAARGIGNLRHNFTAMQMEALYHWALSLPEIIGMDVWKHTAKNIAASSLREAVWPDGVHREQSIGYHIGCIRWYASCLLLGQRNNESWGKEYADRLAHMGMYLDAMILPDGSTPLLSDSDRTKGWRTSLGLVRYLFPAMHFRHISAPGYDALWMLDGEIPGKDFPAQSTSAMDSSLQNSPVSIFPYGGIAVIRYPDEDIGSMVILDNGSNDVWHAHWDNLAVQFEAFAKPILVDPGRWIYKSGDIDRNWVINMQSHNTLFIEDHPIEPSTEIAVPAIRAIHDTDQPVVTPIEHKVIDDGTVRLQTSLQAYRDDPQAKVTRTVIAPCASNMPWLVVFDKIEAPVEHTWTNSWLLPTSKLVEIRDSGYVAELDGEVTLSIVVAASEPLGLRDQEMFWCPNYAEKTPARRLGLSSRCISGWRMFVFVPVQGGRGMPEPPMPTIKTDDRQVTFIVSSQRYELKY